LDFITSFLNYYFNYSYYFGGKPLGVGAKKELSPRPLKRAQKGKFLPKKGVGLNSYSLRLPFPKGSYSILIFPI